MLASLNWLRDLCPFSASAADIAAKLTLRGLAVDAVREADGDVSLEIDVPANRPDCLGHLGLAREIAAAFGQPLAPRPAAPRGSGDDVAHAVRVAIEDPDLCSRYTARIVRGVRVAPSPAWVVRRLTTCGLQPINNVVDASNLVLLELGHPIHAFDLERIDGPAIHVRRARAGERLTTLDGVDRKLDAEVLLIADARRPVALAGVIGGADSEITDATRDVLIEAAWFLPRGIRATAKRLGIATDASHRFERGVDPEGVVEAQETAVRLLAELAGGTPVPGLLDAYPGRAGALSLVVRTGRLRRVLGYEPTAAEITTALRALGMHPVAEEASALRVEIPTWRIDLQREEDLVEEVARHLGYDRIPSRVPSMPEPRAEHEHLAAEERCRDLLAHLGFHEAFNYAMVGEGEDDPFCDAAGTRAMALTNPIAEPLARLRRSILSGLVRGADLNLRRGVRDVRLFEVGRVFLARGEGDFPEEPLRVGLVWCGASRPRHWSDRPPEVDLHDVAGVVEVIFGSLRPGLERVRREGAPAGFHPGRCVSWFAPSGERLAWGGRLHPDLRDALDLSVDVYLAELDLDRVARARATPDLGFCLPRVPSITRDLAVVLGAQARFEDVLRVLQGVASPASASFEVVDRYRGEPLAPDEASLTVRVILQPSERTLTDAQAESYRASLVRAVQGLPGVRLRE